MADDNGLLDQMKKKIKALEAKVEAGEATKAELDKANARIEALEKRLESDKDFDDWD